MDIKVVIALYKSECHVTISSTKQQNKLINLSELQADKTVTFLLRMCAFVLTLTERGFIK